MAKPLLDRIAADLKPAARLADCRRDLAEAEQERADIDARIADAERRSESPSTGEEEARLAHQQAEDWRLYARRLDRGIGDLQHVIAEKEAAQRSEERLGEFTAAQAARDVLVERWRKLGPVFDELFALFADTVANDVLLEHVNRQRPEGSEPLRSAELVARRALNENYWPNSIGMNGEPFRRLTHLEWQFLDKPGRAWPPNGRNGLEAATSAIANSLQRALATSAASKTPEAIEAQRRREAARWTRYEVSQERYRGYAITGIKHRDGAAAVSQHPVSLWMDERQVAAARKAGLRLEKAQTARVIA